MVLDPKMGNTQELNQEPRGKPTRYELENTFKKLRGKPRGIKPSGGIKTWNHLSSSGPKI